jgi:Asp-tRNA(Asn)/Glu-tRNA(Gln) amidotransferase A subunit family amidase
MAEPSAVRIAADVAHGRVSALKVTEACLARIAADEPRVRAWAHLDPAHARVQARALDERKRAGLPLGSLHGLPVGIKDIVDTADFPTENGSVLHAGRRPLHDAWIVSRLRAAGAVLPGKTVTTEFACFTPGPTRNPHDLERTPGGSSSGSAAAVAAGMVPLAIGSQTNGSVIRPASFCGVYGFKPSYGLIPRQGVLTTSATLDHVGVFARSVEDLALLAEALCGHDPADPATRPLPAPPLRRVADEDPPVPPRLAFVTGPTWPEAEPTTREAFAELGRLLGERRLVAVELPPIFGEGIAAHRRIWTAELAFHLDREHRHGRDRLSARLLELIEEGRTTTAPDYQKALAVRERCRRALSELLERFDALVTPAAPGEAPRGLAATGSPAFCTLWSLTGAPAVSLPIMQGPAGLPLGCQLVGAEGDDARLLRTARWLVGLVAEQPGDAEASAPP